MSLIYSWTYKTKGWCYVIQRWQINVMDFSWGCVTDMNTIFISKWINGKKFYFLGWRIESSYSDINTKFFWCNQIFRCMTSAKQILYEYVCFNIRRSLFFFLSVSFVASSKCEKERELYLISIRFFSRRIMPRFIVQNMAT